MPTGFPDYYGGLTLPVTVPEGGTGQTTITQNAILLGNGLGKMVETNVGTANQVLQIPSGGGSPAFQSLTISAGVITGIIPIANGGTGTATPALVAGTSISITGTWPNNTISNTSNYATLADPLPVAHGGTGTATPALVAGAGISLSGSWPNNTITNSHDVYFSSGILAVAHGGTGTATPALVAGANISVTGTWPAQTIALASPLSPTLTMSGTGNTILTISTTNVGTAAIEYDSSDHLWQVGNFAGGQAGFNIYDATNSLVAASMSDSDVLNLHNPLPISSGGTGATSLAAAGILSVETNVDLTSQTASIGATNITNLGTARMYLVVVESYIKSVGGTSTISVSLKITQNTVVNTLSGVVSFSEISGASGAGGAAVGIFVDASTNIQYLTTWTSGGAGSVYDLHIRLIPI